MLLSLDLNCGWRGRYLTTDISPYSLVCQSSNSGFNYASYDTTNDISVQRHRSATTVEQCNKWVLQIMHKLLKENVSSPKAMWLFLHCCVVQSVFSRCRRLEARKTKHFLFIILRCFLKQQEGPRTLRVCYYVSSHGNDEPPLLVYCCMDEWVAGWMEALIYCLSTPEGQQSINHN